MTETIPEQWVPADDFSARLKLVRHSLKLTLREAAEACGFAFATWRTWENGTHPQDWEGVVLAISKNLGVDRDWLAWGEIRPDYAGLRLSRKSGDPDEGPFSGSDIDEFCAATATPIAATFVAA